MQYHHGIELENIVYGEIKPNPAYADDYDRPAFQWLEQQIGFYPLFIAVGETEHDIRMTCYDRNWKRRIGSTLDNNGRLAGVFRKKGEIPNRVVFSYENLEGVFMEFQWWSERVLCNEIEKIDAIDKKLIFNYSWPKDKWLRYAKKFPHHVQLVVPDLYLPDADRIWARNRKTKKNLEAMGFNSVEVKRIKVSGS